MADEMTAAQVANAMANIYRLRHEAAQFTRFAETAKHFKPRMLAMKGENLYWYAYTQPYTGVRRTKSAYETEFPESRAVDHTQVYITWTDLCEFQGTITFTGLAARKTRSAAVYATARKLVTEFDADCGECLNRSLHQNSDCVMGTVAAKYSATTGGSYTTSTSAFFQITDMPVSAFHPGQVLDLRDVSDNATINNGVKVDDVFHTSVGPNAVDDIGPGITVTIDSTRNTAVSGTSDLDTVAATDEIALSTETDSNLDSFQTWFGTGSVLSLTRGTTVGEQWAIPYEKDYSVSGVAVNFDFDDHMRPMARDLARAVKFGREVRKNEGLGISDAMLFLTTDAILDEATSLFGDAARFTTALASSLDGAERKRLFGTVGFDGVVWHNPLLGAIGFQSDAVATPNTARLIEPSSWFFVTGHNSNNLRPEWLKGDGRMWRYVQGSNGRPINKLIAGGLMRLALCCDQPRANYEINGIKSSLTG